MTIWYKQGVIGDMSIPLRKAVGRIHEAYQKKGEDLLITSIREGNHSHGSLHYDGNAVDFRPGNHKVPLVDIIRAAGEGFDVVYEFDHIHVEYDPK